VTTKRWDNDTVIISRNYTTWRSQRETSSVANDDDVWCQIRRSLTWPLHSHVVIDTSPILDSSQHVTLSHHDIIIPSHHPVHTYHGRLFLLPLHRLPSSCWAGHPITCDDLLVTIVVFLVTVVTSTTNSVPVIFLIDSNDYQRRSCLINSSSVWLPWKGKGCGVFEHNGIDFFP